jgi:hypothetical protein
MSFAQTGSGGGGRIPLELGGDMGQVLGDGSAPWASAEPSYVLAARPKWRSLVIGRSLCDGWKVHREHIIVPI